MAIVPNESSLKPSWLELERELRDALGEAVRFDMGHRAVYASDASNYRQVPIGVVVPRSIDAFVQAAAICRRHDAPMLMRGGGTSQNGQCVNEAVVFDMSANCNRIVELDALARTALVEPGVVCDTLRDAAERHNLTFAPDPATHSRCTLGGMIGNNSCGAHSMMAGKTVENVEALEVMTYDGERFWVGPTTDDEFAAIVQAGGRRAQIYQALRDLRDEYAVDIRARFPHIKRRVSGYNLDQLLPENGMNLARALVGTEGTCAFVLNARVTLVASPRYRILLVLGFCDIYSAADAVPEYLRFAPIAIEGLDGAIIRGLEARKLRLDEIALLPHGNAWVVLEFGADSVEVARQKADAAASYLTGDGIYGSVTSEVIADPAQQKSIWLIRETGASANSLSVEAGEPDPQVGWEDAAVDPFRLGPYLRDFQKLVDRYGYKTSLYGHFGDGCVHARITFNLRTHEGVQHWRAFTREAAQLVVQYGGSLSGEHGDGQAKAEFLPVMFGDRLMKAMRAFKEIWDPRNRLNPGKVVDAYRMDENLRAGPEYKVVNLTTRLQFRSAEGDGFQREVERCVGMGRCRSLQGDTMCPSYRATREERFSTRGRARLLWEMLQGNVITDGWNSEPVKEALDTCLSCKGCHSDCPTHTDMASYKAEFLSHYYARRRRPRQFLTMGRIGDWAPWAARMPRIVNFVTQTPLISKLAKYAGGVARERNLPKFALVSHSRLAHKSRSATNAQPKVILWVDTFCEHFHPQVADAAIEVLRQAGFHALLPQKPLCCGRPLYDFGQLDAAREKLARILDALAPLGAFGTEQPGALIGLEPGCMSVFKDELVKLFPDDPRARYLASHSFLLGDFLAKNHYVPPRYEVDVLVHAHCHQKALFGTQSEQALLKAMGARATFLDSGCCGMAGSFGFSPKHVELSLAVGEQSLFPEVRRASRDTIVLTNGFSCREQIAHGTGRQTLHLAELLLMAHEKAEFELGGTVS
jgi:FAD/FMN-containing dehydrogenase/Fe-S oxidoreductase